MDDTSRPAPVHAFGDDALGEHDAVGLAAEIRAGRLSLPEVVEAAIARTVRLEAALTGLATERFEAARAEARAPRGGFFAGQPIFVKDNSDVHGVPTQHGSRAFTAAPATADGDVARMFGLIGTTVLGKSRLSEYGFGPSAEFVDEPAVPNPWDVGHTAGASSAGSAAFVAGGAVAMAHANDGGGSIRIPAACTGLVGLKPTRGRTPSDRMNREMPVRIVQDGVVTRSVRDSAAFLRESERVYRTLRLPPVGDVTGPGKKRLRVALVLDSIGDRTTDEESRRTAQRTAALLEELGHVVVPADLPVSAHFEDDFLDYWSLLALAVSRNGRRLFGPGFDRAHHDALTHGLARRAARRAALLPLAVTRLRRSRRASERFYADHDVLLTPVLASAAPELGWLSPDQPYETLIRKITDWVCFTPLQNATGDPAISLPMGATETGLPIGVQLAAPQGHDRRLLEVAYALEEAQPFARIQDVATPRAPAPR